MKQRFNFFQIREKNTPLHVKMAVLYENATYLYHYYGKMSLFRLNIPTSVVSLPTVQCRE